ncbi:MAG: 23S rRNA (pseudouridine(1915)-N(3))-methyltransferase RlmH [Nitratireductor sp.]|nr:23S rRNA (pseudouridine(1915)-N(3))-methyltransferase RlmH [Nitratireductor sp.]MCB1456125.1 23S rRNA (pseudouridine(1915)-N(3))-methyltransferase RlmH [Nitratireductor sp.]MCB1458709.1 23S rRNA (pseudouridine(1915)-N(3))-methyltransferase RlmH [Nitratireductor sp.]
MRLAICAIGRMKAGPETQLLARYLERATRTGRQLGISGIDVREFPESREQGRQARCLAESATLLKCVSGSARIIALDETGKDETSLGLAEILQNALDGGTSELAFMIGGPDGHDAKLLARSHTVLRMGRMTWPHQLIRVMLAEQVYRALTIRSGHPYHREG